MKKVLGILLLVVSLFAFVACDLFSEDSSEKEYKESLVIIPNFESSKSSKALEQVSFGNALQNNPFGAMNDENLIYVGMSSLPMLYDFQEVSANSISSSGKKMKIFGFPATAKAVKNDKQIYEVEYRLYSSNTANSNEAFGLIDYTYNRSKNTFSYKEYLSVGMGNNIFYYFELKDIPFTGSGKGIKFTTVGANGEPLPYKFARFQLNNATNESFKQYCFAEYDYVMTFSKDLAASCAYRVRGNHFTHADAGLNDSYRTFTDIPKSMSLLFGGSGENGVPCIPIDFDQKNQYRLPEDKSQIDFVVSVFNKIYSGDDGSIITDISKTFTITGADGMYSFSFPVIYSFKEGKGAAIDNSVSQFGYITETNFTSCTGKGLSDFYTSKTNFAPYSYSSSTDFREFVITHFMNCGLSENKAKAIYGKLQ